MYFHSLRADVEPTKHLTYPYEGKNIDFNQNFFAFEVFFLHLIRWFNIIHVDILRVGAKKDRQWKKFTLILSVKPSNKGLLFRYYFIF